MFITCIGVISDLNLLINSYLANSLYSTNQDNQLIQHLFQSGVFKSPTVIIEQVSTVM